MNNKLQELLRDKRGAAMAEGVIVLPFFIIVLAAIIYFHRAYATKISMNTKARSCAWSYAVNGCQKPLPDGCPVSTVGGESKEVTDVFGMDFKNNFGTEESEKVIRDIEKQKSALDSTLHGVNLVGLTILGLSEGIKTSPSQAVQKPSILGGGTHTISGDYSVMCNERNRTVKDLAIAAYCSLSNIMPGCGKND